MAYVKEDIVLPDILFYVVRRWEVAAALKRNEALEIQQLALRIENAALKAKFAAKQEEHERLEAELEEARKDWAKFLHSCDELIDQKVFRSLNTYYKLAN